MSQVELDINRLMAQQSQIDFPQLVQQPSSVVGDFKEMVVILQGNDQTEPVRERLLSLGINVLFAVEDTSRPFLRKDVVDAFTQLRTSSPETAFNLFRVFVRTDIMDRPALRSTLGIPQIQGR